MRRTTLCCLIVALLVGCAPSARSGHGVRIGMLVRGLGDESFSDSANAGLQAARQRLGITPVLLQTRTVSDYQADLIRLATSGAAETFAIGYNMAADLAQVAPRYPQSHFAIIDAVVAAPNVTSVTFRSEEGSFLAGALAALTTRTKTIAFLGGADEPIIRTFEAGYIAGARQIDPSIRVLVKFVGSFEDVAAGKELAGVLYAQRADIIYAAAGSAGLGAIAEAKTRGGAYVIGVDMNEDGLAPGKVLTSVLKRVDVGVYRICALAATGAPRPARMSVGLKEGGVGLTDFRYTRAIVTAADRGKLDTLKNALVRGRLVAPHDLDGLAAFRPAAL